MASKRKRARLLAAWRRYARRNDQLVAHQDLTRSIQHPMHTNPGFFRAEGWDTDNPKLDLRHGC